MDYKQHKGSLRGQIKNQVERKLYNKRIRAEAINVDTGESNCTIFDVRQLLIDFCEIYAEGQFEDPDDIEGIVDWYLKVKDN